METVKELKSQLKQLADASATQQRRYQQLQESRQQLLLGFQLLQQAVASATAKLSAGGEQQPQQLLKTVCSQLNAAGAAARAVLAIDTPAAAASEQQDSAVPGVEPLGMDGAAHADIEQEEAGLLDDQDQQQQCITVSLRLLHKQDCTTVADYNAEAELVAGTDRSLLAEVAAATEAESVHQAAAAAAATRRQLHHRKVMQVLQLALQHSDVKHSIASVCSLLMVVKALQQPIHEHLQGQLAACMPRWADVLQVARWLSKHGSLLRHLDLNLQRLWYTAEEAATSNCEVLAGALRDAAAAAPGGLHLQYFSCSYSSSVLLCALEQTCNASLTSLRTVLSRTDNGYYIRVPDALSGVTALRSLVIEAGDFQLGHERSCHWASMQRADLAVQHERWLEPLSSLTQLTSLSIAQLWSAHPVKHLPPQLQQLELRFEGKRPGGTINISYLTALTGLVTNFQPASFVYDVNNKYGNVSVPKALQLLACHEAHAAAPVLGLTQLPRLQLSAQDACMPASELCLLSRLTSLTEVQLEYRSLATAAEAATAWRGLPVKQLTVHGTAGMLALAHFMQDVGGLTSLSLHHCRIDSRLLGVIAFSCSDLQRLSLRHCYGGWTSTVTGLATLARQLQHLQLLDLRGSCGGCRAAAAALQCTSAASGSR
jgi:hypothetical protein